MARPSRSGTKARLNLELEAETKARLDWCKEYTGAMSITETIRRALVLYEYVLKSGGELQIPHDEHGTVIVKIL